MKRFFNTSGPCQPADHYTIDPTSRLSNVRELIEQKKYFILHAPRQTGKTTTMIGFMEAINQEGKYIALYANIESAQAVRGNVAAANGVFLSALDRHARIYLPSTYWPSPHCMDVPDMADGLSTFLTRWCAELPKPLVLFLDEADALIGDSLLSLLRQLRTGYTQRPANFPLSVGLIGLRDFQDYRIYSESAKRFEIGGSAFNIRDKSLTMGNFTPAEVRTLFAQHTTETGQDFTDEAMELIFEQTQGQPWLVNALGRELCFEENKVPADRTVTANDVQAAIEIIILRRDVHIKHLSDKLTEPRVARVIETILTGENTMGITSLSAEDLQYVIDLGLVAETMSGLQIANPIYREVIPRELTAVQQKYFPIHPAWYLKPDGKLDIEKALEAFFDFYRENAEALTTSSLYSEAAHHLIFMAWLQRIVNGGGYVRREYAVGRKFIDMVILFAGEKFVFELKTEANFVRQKALDQLHQYAQRMGVTEGYLMVFRKVTKTTDPDLVGQRETLQHDDMTVHLIWV